MMRLAGALALPFLQRLEPETAHRAAIAALKLAPAAAPVADPRLGAAAFGLSFANPLGMAAGFDKNAEVPSGLLGAGFGFVEVGTLTPRAQPGNPRPRLFRLARDEALVNRLGFNNDGYDAAHARLSQAAASKIGIVGVNIGPNKDSADRVADYISGIAAFADVASYFTINVSSPNTPGLRDLQQRGALDELIARVIEARDVCAVRRPVLVKIAPDVDLMTLDDIVSVGRARGIDGMIVSNTTISRPPTLARRQRERGRRPFRPTLVRFVDAGSRADFSARGRGLRADRLRRRRRRSRGVGEDRSGRQPRAALYRADLPRTGADRGHPARPDEERLTKRRGPQRLRPDIVGTRARRIGRRKVKRFEIDMKGFASVSIPAEAESRRIDSHDAAVVLDKPRA